MGVHIGIKDLKKLSTQTFNMALKTQILKAVVGGKRHLKSRSHGRLSCLGWVLPQVNDQQVKKFYLNQACMEKAKKFAHLQIRSRKKMCIHKYVSYNKPS